jgi:hypothetical protein
MSDTMREIQKAQRDRAWAAIRRFEKTIEANNKELMNTFLWMMDETVERERPETITFRRPIPFSTETI